MAKTPIKTAKDMYGKKIGVQVANDLGLERLHQGGRA